MSNPIKQKIAPYSAEMYNNFVFSAPKSYAALCKKKTEMVTRGRVEAAFAKNLVFITLTYDQAHIPTTYKKCESLPIFRQRMTRKKYRLPIVPEVVPTKKVVPMAPHHLIPCESKWVEKKSAPLNLKGNYYRHKEIMTEQDFKNAKFLFTHGETYRKMADCGLLIPQHLSDFLGFLRDMLRVHYNDKSLRLRYIANGEYGQNTHRPHYHIVIFNHYPDFDFGTALKMFWTYGRINQCTVVEKNESSIKKLTAYICGHTVKNDSGNQYQNELSPAFRLMSTYGGGIGYQLTNSKLMSQINDDFCRSLHNSLSAWDKKSSVKYQVSGENSEVYSYEFPRFYKDKMLKYLSLDIRQYNVAQCRSIQQLVKNFCQFANLYNKFDLLTVYKNIGLCSSPLDVLTLFIYSNHKILLKNLADLEYYISFARRYLQNLVSEDKIKHNVFKSRYSKRKQERKYQEYLSNNNFLNLD